MFEMVDRVSVGSACFVLLVDQRGITREAAASKCQHMHSRARLATFTSHSQLKHIQEHFIERKVTSVIL